MPEPAAKKRVRMNALRHGLTGQIIVLPSEDHAAWKAHTQAFFDEFQPVGLLETHLVQRIADTQWRLYRAAAWETNLLALHECEGRLDVAATDPQVCGALSQAASLRENPQIVTSLSMYEQRLARTQERSLAELRRNQENRRWRESRREEL